MSNPWFRMYHEFSTDPKVQRLSEVDQRRYIMLLCMRCSNGDVTLQDEDVTFTLRISSDEWAATKRVFLDRNLIDSDNLPTAWEKRQYKSDSSAERVARHRENKKHDVTLQKRDGNAIEQNRTDTEQIQNRSEEAPLSPPATPKADPVPYEKIVSLYHEKLPRCPKVAMLTAKRKGQIGARWKSGVLPDLETWEKYFIYIGKSEFLMGMKDPPEGRKRFVADLEWITNESNFTKIWEGKYHAKV